jgi:hypothetical protein
MTWLSPFGGMLFFYLFLTNGEVLNDKQYGMINRVLTECEYDAMSVGSKLGDAFHSFDESTELAECLSSDYIADNLGFLSHMHQKKKKTITTTSGWTNCSKVSECRYWSLENKWVHIMGDSKAHQVWETFMRPLVKNKASYQDYASDRCTNESPTPREIPPGYSFSFGNGA